MLVFGIEHRQPDISPAAPGAIFRMIRVLATRSVLAFPSQSQVEIDGDCAIVWWTEVSPPSESCGR